MRFDGFEALTFDCYGTLIDWERGILAALRPVLAAHGADAEADDAVLERFGRLEAAAEQGAWRLYREVLGVVLDGVGAELGFRPTPEERAAFGGSVAEWPAFADSADSLAVLTGRFRLAIVSNVDDDLFAASAARLGAPPFADVVTAQQVRSYKPATAHFDEVVRRLGLPVARVLHVAQSLYHDIAPASRLGFATVWVNRRGGREGTGATAPAVATADVEVPDLATLARLATR